MANKVFNMAGGLHSAAAYSAFENALYGSCVATTDDFVATAGTGMNVSLSAGNGLISTGSGFARRIASDAANTISITAAASTDRIDSIVAYIDNSVTPTTSVVDNTNDILKFVAVAGTAAATPSAPSSATIQSAIGAGNPYMVLWDVTIPANATALTNATFTDKRAIADTKDDITSLRASMTINNFNSSDTISSLTGFTISDKILTLAQSANSASFKFYGRIVLANTGSSSKNVPSVAIPGLSKYGVATGLYLTNAPSEAFWVHPAGVRANMSADQTSTKSVSTTAFGVGSNGQIYICGSSSSSGLSIPANTAVVFFYPPCIYYNTNFGDGGTD